MAAINAPGRPHHQACLSWFTWRRPSASPVALAPKSNSSHIAYEHAKKDALHTRSPTVPLAIRNAPTRLMKTWDTDELAESNAEAGQQGC